MADRTPPRVQRPRRVENFAVRRNRNVSEYNRNINNNIAVRSFNEMNQMGAPAQLPGWWLAKTNMGSIQIPADKRQNQTNLTDIEDGEHVVRIRQNGFDFFYRLENWVRWMTSSLSRFPNKPVPHPTTRVPVAPDEIDIFTANIQAGGKRSRKSRRTRRRRRN
jgi:hypothetical protein